MNVKLDTKEKFTVITPTESKISAIMTAELQELLYSFQKKDIPHVILNFKHVTELELEPAQKIVAMQQEFYEKGHSCVICELKAGIEKFLDENEMLELMNVTPTESEAWDIVQMEEIERDLLGDGNGE